jgi:hypothetical protein
MVDGGPIDVQSSIVARKQPRFHQYTFQAIGTTLPEPGTPALLGVGLFILTVKPAGTSIFALTLFTAAPALGSTCFAARLVLSCAV